jgi:hypothetical protein
MQDTVNVYDPSYRMILKKCFIYVKLVIGDRSQNSSASGVTYMLIIKIDHMNHTLYYMFTRHNAVVWCILVF